MITLIKYYLHFKTITRHKIEVGKVCFKLGLYWQGITHDLSKYGFSEFNTSAKFFQGNSSPIDAEKDANGYSYAWLHHRGRNPHHWEYWMDNFSKGGEPMKIPYRYCVEMICDWIGAGKVYNKEGWNIKEPFIYFNKKISNNEIILHQETQDFLVYILAIFSQEGYAILNTKFMKDVYYNTIK